MVRDAKQTKWTTWLVLLVLALGLGWSYRTADLAKRPMHTDEAILGVKTIELMNTGRFQYDPHDYHGPFLHYATRFIAKLSSWTPDNLNEQDLRWVIVLFGMGLVLVPVLASDVLGRLGSAFAALLIAVSPMMTYYSRYYIMEVPFALLVALFMFACWRWSQSKNVIWLILAGVVLGFMHATKETFILNIVAMFAGWLVAKIFVGSFELKRTSFSFGGSRRRIGWRTAIWTVVIVAALVSVSLFSNGFHDWQSVKESVQTYQYYFERSGGSGHEKPWFYYITLLFWRRQAFVWSEALIGGLAVIGMLNAFLNTRRPSHHRAFLIFLSVYAIALLVGYSILPYKTPWSILCVNHAFALLAGVGVSGIFRVLYDHPFFKTLVGGLLAIGLYNLCQQTSLAIDWNYPQTRYAASEVHNPYAYSHTSPNLVLLSKHIHEFAALSPAGNDMPIQVIQSEQGWPLGWYLRDLKKVGYQSTIPNTLAASVIITDVDKEDAVRAKLSGNYESMLYTLRPDVNLSVLVQQDIADKFLGKPPATPPPVAPTPPTPEPTPPIMPSTVPALLPPTPESLQLPSATSATTMSPAGTTSPLPINPEALLANPMPEKKPGIIINPAPTVVPPKAEIVTDEEEKKK